MEIAGDESGAGSLDLVGAGFDGFARACLRDDRGVLGLDRNGAEGRFALLDDLAHTGDSASGADGRDEDVDLAIRVFPDLFGSCLRVDRGVGLVVELLGNPGIGRLLVKLLRTSDGALHSFGSRSEDELGAEESEQSTALQTHGLGHGEDELVSLGGRDEGKCDARIAAGGLDDCGAGLEVPLGLGISNHGRADTVLDAAEWIEEFALQRDGGGKASGHSVEADERGAANGVDDGVVNSAHGMEKVDGVWILKITTQAVVIKPLQNIFSREKCSKRDLNPHSFRNQILSLARLPISPFERHTKHCRF